MLKTKKINPAKKSKENSNAGRLQRHKNFSLTLLAIPALVWFFIFSYMPMGGAIIAFKNYKPKLGILGSPWVGLDNFKYLFSSNDASRILTNTLFFNFVSIFIVAAFAIFAAVMMDVVSKRLYLKVYQSMMFLPRFISWVVVGFIAFSLFDYNMGLLNRIGAFFGKEPVSWYMTPKYWRGILLIANIWKNIGYTSLIYYGSIIPRVYRACKALPLSLSFRCSRDSFSGRSVV